MVTDPIGDLISQIKNAFMAGKGDVVLPHSRLKESVAKVLCDTGYLKFVETVGDNPKRELKLTLMYTNKIPALTDIKRKSKPGLRVYVGKNAIPSVISGLGVAILSTPQGVMTGTEAKKRNIGGELLCVVW
ncbi:MAG: 30S ribosomal protein S8 [Patescibacteria group bacterium]